ncbi:phytanoyl-CoA dioxygenase family protein [Alloalcanivorax xenomutans]|uniref:phytanoyl-CoA dioxygenase family protein n=1 Tax=Alloalcanivorax xenomutans TaxID=1094342 RepID=UPI003BAA33D7
MIMKIAINYAKAIIPSIWMHFFAGKGELRSLLYETAKVNKQALSISTCLELIERIEVILSDSDHPRVWRDKIGSDSRIWGFEKDIAELVEEFEVERWIKAVDQYTGRKTRSWCLMANRVVPIGGNLGSGGGMHRDSPFSHQVKCIWYLNNVDGSNGPFQYLPGTNTNLVRDRNQYPLGVSRFNEIKVKAQEVHAKAGSLLICDTKCIHGGKPIESGLRYAVTLYTFPGKAGPEKIFEQSGLDPALV